MRRLGGPGPRLVPAAVAAVLALALSGLAAVLTGCGSDSVRHGPGQRTPSPVRHVTGGGPAHIAVVIMENEEYGDIIGSRSTPYINGLARRYALVASMYAITHPSLPNYLALTGGSTFGINSDCTDCSVASAGLPTQLSRAHISWKAYMEGLPHPCFTGAGAGQYAKKHDPFVYYKPTVRDRAQCARVVPLRELSADERAHTLPRFIWITPNLCHDMHDCSPAVGDRFLSGLLPPLLRDLGRRGLLFLTWDEGSTDAGCCRRAAGGHIATVIAGPGARKAARITKPVDHYSTLQTIEDLLGLRRLRGAACRCTPTLAPLLSETLRKG
jgi:phosphatidylinositol-3-phosphatase